MIRKELGDGKGGMKGPYTDFFSLLKTHLKASNVKLRPASEASIRGKHQRQASEASIRGKHQSPESTVKYKHQTSKKICAKNQHLAKAYLSHNSKQKNDQKKHQK